MTTKQVIREISRLMDRYSTISRDMSREEDRQYKVLALRIKGLKAILGGAPQGLQWLDDYRRGIVGSWD
jgi:hypothetical protein